MMVIDPSEDHHHIACFAAAKSFATINILASLSSLGMVGVPPHQRHPQVPLFTQTGMPKYDLFSEPHFLIVTFQETTINHLIYMWKVPFLYRERACVIFSGFEICCERFFCVE